MTMSQVDDSIATQQTESNILHRSIWTIIYQQNQWDEVARLKYNTQFNCSTLNIMKKIETTLEKGSFYRVS